MTATPALTQKQFTSEVRGFIRDFPELNRLILGEESSNRMIDYCTWLALDEWNTTPPLSANTVATFPSRFLLLRLTIIHLLTSVGLLKSRNRLAYNDGGFSVDAEAQDDRYMRWVQWFRNEIATPMRNLKVALNIAGAWGGGVSSEYAALSGYYDLT